nr:phospholipase-like protein [Tanacetum cinerariifolium]
MLFDHESLLIDYMLRRQHKVDGQHHDMPLIYYMEGHKLHFGRQEFFLITGFFGTDEEIFCKLSDDDAMHLCLLLALEESRSTSNIRPTIVEYQSSWWIDNNLYFQEFVPRAPPIKEHHGLFETYLSKLEKARKRGKTCFMVSSIGGLSREKELRLCLEGEEKMRCEHQKLIVEENRIRLDESKRLRLEEENML